MSFSLSLSSSLSLLIFQSHFTTASLLSLLFVETFIVRISWKFTGTFISLWSSTHRQVENFKFSCLSEILNLRASMILLHCLFSTEFPGFTGQAMMQGIIKPSTELLCITYYSKSNTRLQVMMGHEWVLMKDFLLGLCQANNHAISLLKKSLLQIKGEGKAAL